MHGGVKAGGFGLANRAEEIGGRFALHAEPGSGTSVTATLPLAVRP